MVAFYYSQRESWAKIRIADPAEFIAPRKGNRIFLPCALIDACVYSAGVHEWTIDRTAITLPFSIDRLRILTTPVIGEQAMARILPLESTDEHASFNVDVWATSGRPLLQIENYREGAGYEHSAGSRTSNQVYMSIFPPRSGK